MARRVNELLAGNWVEVFTDPVQRAERTEALEPLIRPDFEYRSAALAEELGFQSSYRGVDGFAEATLQFIDDFEEFSLDQEAVTFEDVGDGRVLIHGWNVIRTRAGDEMRFPGSGLMTIEDGRVRRYESFTNRADAERAAGRG